MASFDNLLRPAFPAEPWFSDAFARDTDALTRALTNSVSTPAGFFPSDASLFQVLDAVGSSPSPIPDTPRGAGQSITVSASGSDLDTGSKRTARRTAPGPSAGKAGKRRSRPSKKSTTMVITADAENFRQMVQQVTGGVKFAKAPRVPSMQPPIVKPEAQRVIGRIQGCLPTLDTSAFLLEHHQQVVGHGGAVATKPKAAEAALALASRGDIGGDGGADGVGGSGTGGLDYSSFSCFPTLESWAVM